MRSTLLHKQIRVAKFNSKLASALVKHDLLLDEPNQRKQNRITEKSDLNVYTFRGQKVTSKKERKDVLKYVNSLYENDNKDFDSKAFSQAKYKLKKWIDSDKISDDEKNLYKILLNITDNHKNKTVSVQNALEKLSNIDSKISRYNDKKKALTRLLELHNQKINLDIDSESQLNTRVISTIFKIPNHNKTPLSGEEQQEILNDYYKTNFPNYEVIYSVIHKDEINDHVHNMIDGKNQKTNKFDFVQNQYEYILNKNNLPGFPGKYSECSAEELRIFGELTQKDFYEFANIKLENKNIIFEKKQYDSEYEKSLDRVKIKSDTSKPIADRAYNTATFLEENKNKVSRKNKEIKQENSALKEENKDLKTTGAMLLSKINSLIKSALDYAKSYAQTDSLLELEGYKISHSDIKKVNEDIANTVEQQAIELQPTDLKKAKIKGRITIN